MKESFQTVIYIRIYSDEQRIPGLPIEEQKSKLYAYAEKHNLNIIAQYIDDNLSTDFNDSQLKKIFVDYELKKINPDCLICVRPDRFSKNVFGAAEMQLQIMGLGIEVRFLEQNCDEDNPLEMINSIVDELLSDDINTTDFKPRSQLPTKMGIRNALKNGRWVNKAPFGYLNDTEKKRVVKNPETAQHIIRAFELMATNLHSLENISQIIKDEGFYFSKTKLIKILCNKFYCGIIEIRPFRGEPRMSVVGIHEPLISEEMFNQVQKLLVKPKKKHKKKQE